MNYLQYFMIQAVPKPDNEDESETDGAYVSCWINFKINDGAELLAKYYIEQYGWIPGKVEEHTWVERHHYDDNPESLSYFLEAEADGASFVFHNWPKDAPDAHEEV